MFLNDDKKYLEDIKNNLTIEQIRDLLVNLQAEPIEKNGNLISRTICHNGCGCGSHKLYYFSNTHLFKCFTDCGGEAWDVFHLIQKVNNWTFPQSIKYIEDFFNIPHRAQDFDTIVANVQDWKILNKYEQLKEENDNRKITMKIYECNALKYLPRPKITNWEEEGITSEVMNAFDICYNPVSQAIVIPHYDDENNLIGIRERTLIKENEDFGKYKPAIINGIQYNHPLGFSLYGLNMAKNNIKDLGVAIVGEGEKFVLGYCSYFGTENNIAVACCGSSLIKHQIDLLLKYDVKEIVIAWDKQFKEVGDDEWKIWTKKLNDINNRYGSTVQISYMFDRNNDLEYKMSPIDAGKDIFLKMFKERIRI